MLHSIRDWLCTAIFALVFGATLLIFDVLQRVAFLFGQRPQEYVAGMLQVALVQVMRLAGAHLEVQRSPAIRPHTPYLIVSNHQSMMDIPIFATYLFTNFPKYISKASLAKWIPSISFNLRRGGHALIDRSDRDQALGAIRQLAEQVNRRHVSAVIFPEGTRARGGALGAFKPLGALALLDAAPDIAVLPVCIDNSWRFVRYNFRPVPFGVRIKVWIGEPIARHPGEDRGALLASVEKQIRAKLEEMRQGDR